MNTPHFHSIAQLQALCTLAVQDMPTSLAQNNCPDEQQLMAFVQGQLSDKDRELFLHHLRICPACYQEWQMVCDCLNFAPQITAEPNLIFNPSQGIKNRLNSFFIRLKNEWRPRFSIHYPHFVLSTGILSLFLISWLLLRILMGASVHQQLDEMYSELSHEHAVSTQQILTEFTHPLFRSTSAQGFMAQQDISTAQQAFAAGLWMGQQLLDNNDRALLPIILQAPNKTNNWLNTPWEYHYELGRWTMALWVVSQFNYDMSDQYWYRQRGLFAKIYQNFITEIEKNSLAEGIIPRLDQIIFLLNQLPNTTMPQLYEQLGRELEILMHTLAGRI